MLALTSVRSGELREMRWVEIEQPDGEKPLWRVPPERMKMKREHLVPLSRQAVEVLQAARVGRRRRATGVSQHTLGAAAAVGERPGLSAEPGRLSSRPRAARLARDL